MANIQIVGPYRVKNIGVNGDVYKVVEMIDLVKNSYRELNPDRTYLNRQSAYGKCRRLNKRWQDDHMLDDNYDEMVSYFSNR